MQVINETQIVPLIKKLMEQVKINNAELGRLMGHSRAYISKVLNSKDTDFIEAKLKIIKMLGVDTECKKEVKIFIK